MNFPTTTTTTTTIATKIKRLIKHTGLVQTGEHGCINQKKKNKKSDASSCLIVAHKTHNTLINKQYNKQAIW